MEAQTPLECYVDVKLLNRELLNLVGRLAEPRGRSRLGFCPPFLTM